MSSRVEVNRIENWSKNGFCKKLIFNPGSGINGGDRGNTGLLIVAGYVGLIMGLSALYTALAIVLNDAFGRTVAPI